MYSEESSIQEHKVETVSILEEDSKEYSMASFKSEPISTRHIKHKLKDLSEKAATIKEKLSAIKSAAKDFLFMELKQKILKSLKNIVQKCEAFKRTNKSIEELDTTKETSGELKTLTSMKDKENQEEIQQAIIKNDLLRGIRAELENKATELEKKEKEMKNKILAIEEYWKLKLEEIQMENKDLIEEYDKCQAKY